MFLKKTILSISFYCNKIVFIKHIYGFFRLLYEKTKPIKNYSYLANEILKEISSIDIPIYPMFGTLLSIYRDKNILFADDFDFAINDKQYINYKLITHLEKKNFSLYSFSIVENKIILLTFNYKGVYVDIFLIEKSLGKSIHVCPDFRKSYSKTIHLHNIIKTYYPRYFLVYYPKIKLKNLHKFNLLIPKDPVSIFVNHYGHDWSIPKKKDYISFDKYTFVEKPSFTYTGNSKHLISFIRKNNLLSE